MNDFFCYIIDSWEEWTLKDKIEVIYFIFLMFGVVIALIQLSANTKAQRALRSPMLYIYCPKGADPINGLMLKNEGNAIATNITVKISEKTNPYYRIKLYLCNKRVLSTAKKIEIINRDAEELIVGNELYNAPVIRVKVIYCSPFHNKKITKNYLFKRDNDGEKNHILRWMPRC